MHLYTLMIGYNNTEKNHDANVYLHMEISDVRQWFIF